MFTSDLEQAHSVEAATLSVSAPFEDFRVIGLNYRTAALPIRNAVSFTGSGIRALLEDLKARQIKEALVASTCNRTEVYFSGPNFEPVLSALSSLSEVPSAKLDAITYQLVGKDSIRQLFRVACGLDSAVLGEHEILGQLKAAHQISKEIGMVGRRLESFYQRALRTSKRVRTETELGRGVTSFSSMALRKASHYAGGLKEQNVLLIGAGQIAERVAKDLFHAGCGQAYVCNRTVERAERLASMYGLHPWAFERLEEGLAMADIVVCAVSSAIPILDEERLLATRNGQPVVVVDLGVPPNFRPRAGGSEKDHGPVRLVEMEAIVKACHAGSQSRVAAVPRADSILDEELEALERDLFEREAAPYIKALTDFAEEIRSQNLEWALTQNPSASAKDRKLLEDLSIRIVRGMLEAPIQALKSELREPVERAVLARLFAVEAPSTP